MNGTTSTTATSAKVTAMIITWAMTANCIALATIVRSAIGGGVTMTELPYEHAAMHGEPMPDNITSEADQLCYIALTLLYRLFRAKLVDRDEGKRIKAQMRYVLDKAKRMEDFHTAHCHAMNRTYIAVEQHVKRYKDDREPFRQNPTPDNAARLVAVMDGIIETLYPTIPGSVELEDVKHGDI